MNTMRIIRIAGTFVFVGVICLLTFVFEILPQSVGALLMFLFAGAASAWDTWEARSSGSNKYLYNLFTTIALIAVGIAAFVYLNNRGM